MDLLMQYLWAAGYTLPPEAHSPPVPLPKGTCPHCRQHIGRGVHFHARRCKK